MVCGKEPLTDTPSSANFERIDVARDTLGLALGGGGKRTIAYIIDDEA